MTPNNEGEPDVEGSAPTESMDQLRRALDAIVDEAGPLLESVRSTLTSVGLSPEEVATAMDGATTDRPRAAHEGASTCRSCPVCRALDTVRTIRPEALDHLRIALDHLAAAAAMIVAGAATDSPDGAKTGAGADSAVPEATENGSTANDSTADADGAQAEARGATTVPAAAGWPPSARVWSGSSGEDPPEQVLVQQIEVE